MLNSLQLQLRLQTGVLNFVTETETTAENEQVVVVGGTQGEMAVKS